MTTIQFLPQQSQYAIILNGQPDHQALFSRDILKYDFIIICDGAWNYLSNNKAIIRHANLILLGDGDSINNTPDNFLNIECQETTDFEKAMNYLISIHLPNNPNTLHTLTLDVDIFCATGGSLDHTLGNLSIASKYAHQCTCHFFSTNQYYRYVMSDCEISGAKDKTVSFYPFPQCNIHSSDGLLYPMSNYQMTPSTQQSIRNQATSNNVAIHASGTYYVFIE